MSEERYDHAAAQAEATRKLSEDFDARQNELAAEVAKAAEEDRTDAVGVPVKKAEAKTAKK